MPTYIDLMYSSEQGTFTPITADYTHNNQLHKESLETIISPFTNKDSQTGWLSDFGL